MSNALNNSSEDQELLQPVSVWAAHYVDRVLPIFESIYPNESLPRQAVEAAREFGRGKKRDNDLRTISLSTFKLGKTANGAPKYVTRAASAAAAVAYTHTDLVTGIQGIRQARHILGPVVYAALALGEGGGNIIDEAIADAPSEVRLILQHMPPQPSSNKYEDMLFARLDAGLRNRPTGS